MGSNLKIGGLTEYIGSFLLVVDQAKGQRKTCKSVLCNVISNDLDCGWGKDAT